MLAAANRDPGATIPAPSSWPPALSVAPPILLRSRERGLAASDKIGAGLSGNGDVLGFAYNTDQEINGIGWGDRKPDLDNPVGPT